MPRWLPLVLLLCFAAVLRAVVLRTDLWLDEAWSFEIARGCTSLTDIWADPRNYVDNNHPLVTAWMMIVGPVTSTGGWWIYRLPSFLAGLTAIGLAYRTFGRLPALWLTVALPFTVYGTEARGYAPALAALLACLTLLRPEFHPDSPTPTDDQPSSPSLLRLLTYWLLCAIGLWSHFTFIHVLAGLLMVPRSLKRNLAYHAVPLATVALTYFLFVRHLKIAGGPTSELRDAIIGMASLLGGGPEKGWMAYLTAACVLTPCLLVSAANFRDRLTRGAAVACLAALATLLIKVLQFGRPEVVFPRYFLLAGTFAGLVLAREVARQYTLANQQKRRAVQALFGAIAVVTLGFATLDSIRFVLVGRGQFLAPLKLVAASSEPTLCSDYDSRTQRLIDYYRPWLPGQIFYTDALHPGAPRWYLANTGSNQPKTPHGYVLRGQTYVLRKIYPAVGPSGWSWQLYERQETH